MKLKLAAISALIISSPIFAATPVDLSHQKASFLTKQSLAQSGIEYSETLRATDKKNNLHARIQQTYRGYKVWGADAATHTPNAGQSSKSLAASITPNTTMNGTMYQNLNQDLASAPATIFTDAHLQQAIDHAIKQNPDTRGNSNNIKNPQGELLVYVDDANKAHWAYKISFELLGSATAKHQMPTVIMDATNYTVYQSWNNLQSVDYVKAGGFGGNHKTGQKSFDALDGVFAAFTVQRDPKQQTCQMVNEDIALVDVSYTPHYMQFPCFATNPDHNNIYWNGNHDMVATTWSPSNDVMFGIRVTKSMYNEWMDLPVLVKNGQPAKIIANVHDSDENAYWDGSRVIFGDSVGSTTFNPFTQLDTVAHELSHGFTQQHSNLVYYGQSGGLNEAYSDIAGIAAEYYAYGKTDFLVGLGDVTAEGKALRYMDQPSKDCEGRTPGKNCSIDTLDQYRKGMNPHYSSGLFNRAYYILANKPGWDAQKAFEVFASANAYYWTSEIEFESAAFYVLSAASHLDYNIFDVKDAFKQVGIDLR